MTPLEQHLRNLTPQQLEAYWRSRASTFSPMGGPQFTRQQVAQEINRRGILNAPPPDGAPRLTPEQIQLAIQGRYSEIPSNRPYIDPRGEGQDVPLPTSMGVPPEFSMQPRGVPEDTLVGAPPTVVPNALPIPPDFVPPPGGPTRQAAGGGRGRGAAPPQARQPDPSEVDAAMPAGDPAATMNAGMSERDKNRWLAVLAGGLGMLGGDSPSAAVNIGRGGLAGVQAFQNWEQERRQNENRQRTLDIQEAYRRDQGEYMRTMGSARMQQLEQQMQLAQMRLAQASTAQERAAAANEVARLEHLRKVAADENRLEIQRRTLEEAANRNDPVVRSMDAHNQRRIALLQTMLREAGDPTSPLSRLTPDQLADRADQLASPQVPGPMRQQLREAYAAFNRGDLSPERWNQMTRDFRIRFNVDPELYLR